MAEVDFDFKFSYSRAEIHQALLSQFSLLVEFFIGKETVKDLDRRVLNLVNLDPGIQLPDTQLQETSDY